MIDMKFSINGKECDFKDICNFVYDMIQDCKIEDVVKEEKAKQQEEEEKVPTNKYYGHDVTFYMQILADKWGWDIKKVSSYLDKLMEFYPMLSVQLVLKTIAKHLDKQYKAHISESNKLYAISVLDGKISKVDKSRVKNYNTFAAFRTYEDAFYAYSVLETPFKVVFNDK